MTNDASGSKYVSAEENLRGRFARGEIDAEEYERLSGVLKSHGGAERVRRSARSKLLVVGLAAATLLTLGAGAVYAQGGSMMGGNGTESEVDSNGMDGMMNGGRMDSMMGGQGGGMGSMMGDGKAGSMMGSFDEDQPFDLQFIDQMIMHHEGAIMSSEHMISDSKRPELRKLAEDIQESQSEQVEQMKTMRKQWYPGAERTFGMMDPTRMEEMMGDGMMEGMMGSSMREMMGADATDEMFLEMMIPHHQMAVDMSEKALTEAEHPELEDLARKIEEEQSAEIELMERYLEEIEAADES